MENPANSDNLVVLFSRNSQKVTTREINLVKSGELAGQYGPKYSAESLQHLAEQMNLDVQELVPGSNYKCEERKLAEKARKWQLNYFYRASKIGNSEMLSSNKEYGVYRPHLRNFLHSQIYNLLVSHIPTYIGSKQKDIDYATTIGTDPVDNHFTFKLVSDEGGKKHVNAKVTIQDAVLPVTQEEYFHAAQEITFGNVGGLEFLDRRISLASNHVTHSSIALDRVLSSAAAEIGQDEFQYWADKADQVTGRFKDKYVGNLFSPWNRTPLGKEVNKRFRYPIVDYRELGAMLFNFSQDMENFLFYENGQVNDNNQALIDIISVQFGLHHKDLVYQLLDLVDTKIYTEKDFERIGKSVVEWGKKVLIFYKGDKPMEEELVTHHTHIEKEIDMSLFKYEIPRRIGMILNESVKLENSIPTTLINLQKLAQDVYDSSYKKVNELVNVCFPENADVFVEPDLEILEKCNLTPALFKKLLITAQSSYNQYLKDDKILNLTSGSKSIRLINMID